MSEEPRPARNTAALPWSARAISQTVWSQTVQFCPPIGDFGWGRAELGYCWRECIHSQVSGHSLDAGARAQALVQGMRDNIFWVYGASSLWKRSPQTLGLCTTSTSTPSPHSVSLSPLDLSSLSASNCQGV